MIGYTFRLNCSCGSTLEHVTSGKVFEGIDTSAIARCPACHREWQVLVRLLRIGKFPDSTAAVRQRRHRAKQNATP